MLSQCFPVSSNEGHWFIPPGVAAVLFGSTTALSYLLAFKADLGALGIGLGGSLAQIGVCTGLKLWFLQDSYQKYQLYQKLDAPLKEILIKLLSSGWKLSLQRLSEWGNLMLIATVIGMHSNKDLKASNPSIQYIGLIAASLQGIAQATGMLLVRNKRKQDKALERKDTTEAMQWNHRNKMTIIQSNAIALLINGSIASTFYFCREPLANFFLDDAEDHETHILAETLLWVNMLGLLPDSIRIISAGALRGWGDILWPTMISLLTMIMVGVPLGYGAGEFFSGDAAENNEATWMFYM
ncbi:MATE family efflux transporter [Rickettsiella endosymbiont of Dermanyssus gallinae]|uniref:MATE family efflux transporter n=1 Tax=Rickettsiella endosymbiont of Dermanyssus gallinae TaxID=2856608 RepID=UPI001C5311F4|nr:MATE family efflux transporter [Rickettsiella endosymbiont of Dermanyssus gallinae]